ncbi:MAG: TolC family protein, partial [Desulfuromusa sp.]
YETLLALANIKPEIAATEKTPEYTPQQPLLLAELIRQVVADNQQIQMQKTDWLIRQTEADRTRAIFEPELITSLERESRDQRNSIEESLSRDLATTYSERNWNFDAAVQTLAPTGGKVKLGYNYNQLSNSLTRSLTDEENEYQMYLGVNLTQPLLKNAGAKATKTGIMSADLETSSAFQEYRLKMMQRVSKVSIDYWDYYQAYKKLMLRNDSHRIAEKILTDNQERHRTGKMAETEVLEAIIGVHTRKSLLSETAHEQLEIANRLRSLLALTSSSFDAINRPKPAVGNKPLPKNTAEQAAIPVTFVRTDVKHILDSSMGLIFTYGKSGLTPAMEQDLIELAATLKGKQNLFLKVVGHTDSHMLSAAKAKVYGDNFGLGRARAKTTANYLASQLGLKKDQYKAETGGPFEPVADNDTAAGRAKNRRVEIFISYDQPVSTKESSKTKIIPAPKAAVSLQSLHPLNLAITEPMSIEPMNFNSDVIIETAFKLRPEYLAARKKLQQADIKITFAKNQRWPELDLLASYGLNGLDFNTGDSWKQIEDGEYASWSAGLQLRLPLQGGIESRSKLRKSELEKRRQLMVLKDIEIELKNRIDTAIDNVARTTEQLQYAEQIIDIQKRLFDTELIKLKAGQSSSRLVLEKEDNYRSAREAALTNTVKRQRALVEMELASGTILQKYGVDIMETKL